jgi:cytochrome c biogenesis protein CcmG, thiol:disulfide interchange protein DsbE
VGKPAPAFTLPQLEDPATTIAQKDMLGKVWLLNVWASWCATCREEHHVLLELARSGTVPVYGLNYKDGRAEALTWLTQLGNPYVATAFDADGKVGIDYGVYGTPETYVIDRKGVIRYKQIGAITDEVLRSKIMPLVRELQK